MYLRDATIGGTLLNFYEKLKNKRPFVYEDHKGLIVAGQGKVSRLAPAEHSDNRCSNWLSILNEGQDDGEKKEAYKKLISYASLISECNKNKIELKDYLDGLTTEEMELLKKQVSQFVELYKQFVTA